MANTKFGLFLGQAWIGLGKLEPLVFVEGKWEPPHTTKPPIRGTSRSNPASASGKRPGWAAAGCDRVQCLHQRMCPSSACAKGNLFWFLEYRTTSSSVSFIARPRESAGLATKPVADLVKVLHLPRKSAT